MISLSSEPLTHIGAFPVTNTLIDMLIVDAILFGATWYIYKHIQIKPGKVQAATELMFSAFSDLTEAVAGERTKLIFPFVMTFFLFILISNWSGLLPILTNITVNHGSEQIPLIRSASTDLNVTLALAFVSLVATHSMSISKLGVKQWVGRFFSLNPLQLYSGILELISEFTKIISFSFRLFGNIFVGEVMLASLSTVFAFLLPVPLMFYELFVGAVQATIFALLTMAFMALFTTPHEAQGH